MGSHSHGRDASPEVLERATQSHHEFLGSFLGSQEKAEKAIFYSYKRHINGFAANLEEEEAAEIAKHPSAISVFPNQGRKLHTTHSWNFMLFEDGKGEIIPNSAWDMGRFGEDTIVANLDTGVWPESLSFNDYGYGPVPSRWRGSCENNTASGVVCNRKLIGAKYYSKGYEQYAGPIDPSMKTPRDYNGHGTHTLSTAAGNFVSGAKVFGLGRGTVKGGSPRARVASYKVCWPPAKNGECFDADMLEAFDEAIHDGVDVLSVSIGGDPIDYFKDGISIGTFHAVKNGIVVVCSAGNSGPDAGTVTNVSPWIITVGASTLDREFQADVKIKKGAHGEQFKGLSLSMPLPEDRFYPLITGAQAQAANASALDAMLCKPGNLDPEKATGNIVVCLRGQNARVEKGRAAALAGAAGMILCNNKELGNDLIADPHVLPATHINYEDGTALFAYVNTTKYVLLPLWANIGRDPRGFITAPRAVVGTKPAPFMASFSSKGPNTITPEILKPDITAPGVNIIASYSEATSPTGLPFDDRKVKFNVDSGTSMSCPHVSGVVGLLKTLHPDWSPAAIKSAIMTSARTRDNTMKPMLDGSFVKATPFSYGAGHLRPNRAVDPGLVYDMSSEDYLDFLCALGYNQTMIQQFTDEPHKCPDSLSLFDVNYPSFSVPNFSGKASLYRRVKNVGSPGTYKAVVHHPLGVSVSVEPTRLTFVKVGEEKEFRVALRAHRRIPRAVHKVNVTTEEYAFGGLTWTDGKHFVRSPIVVGFPN
ncbi:hypothetical protein CDL15_Pgr004058 [Punica granatum]|uniref:Subtilisin-like protease SBT5.4 n=1 Tax=Punica granatum TaxID=22663 RepID=A0A218XG21_PUNGR|nr:hypothetical protein CDL15_Pgr004058 [Punica granatum]